MKGDSPESAGRLHEASGNGRPRGMTAATSRATPVRNRTRLTDDVDHMTRASGSCAIWRSAGIGR